MSKNRKYYDEDRYISRREYNEDTDWLNTNFRNLDKNDDAIMDRIEENQQWAVRQFDTFSKAHNNLNKRVRGVERREFALIILTGFLTYVVTKHDKILKSYSRRMERLEYALRNGRERKVENNDT